MHLIHGSHPLPMVEQSEIYKHTHAPKSFCFSFQTGKLNSARIKNRESKGEEYVQLFKPFNCYSKMIGLIPRNNLAVLMHRVWTAEWSSAWINPFIPQSNAAINKEPGFNTALASKKSLPQVKHHFSKVGRRGLAVTVVLSKTPKRSF